MKKDEIFSKITGSSIPTYYNWKREERPLINFIKKYQDDIEEFIETGKCSKLENAQSFDDEDIKNLLYGIFAQKKLNEIGSFEPETILMYRVYIEQRDNINADTSLYELIDHIEKYDLKIFKDIANVGITKNTKERAIAFMQDFKEYQVKYIVENFDVFLKILWDQRNFMHKNFTTDVKPI